MPFYIFIMESNKASKDAEEITAASPMKDIKDLEPPSFMTRKFFQAEQSNYSSPPSRVHAPSKEFHFFYGTLMDSQTLAKILKLDSLPRLVLAKVSGYHCKLWGEYPALVGGEPDELVHGMAYEVQSPGESELLQAYETDHSLKIGCIVEFEDGSAAIGNTFKWCGDKTELREGKFNLKDWKLYKLEQDIDSARYHWSHDQ
jgi:gamma-glutamylcyclotransferase (GGCT)/AIG2-like uncharacterized protein YtfP